MNLSAQSTKKTKVPKTQEYNWVAEKDTSLIGKAFNAKSGAVIVTLDEKTYYIENLNSWTAKMEGKILKVTGRLTKKNSPIENPDPKKELVQSSPEIMFYVTKAKWRVMK